MNTQTIQDTFKTFYSLRPNDSDYVTYKNKCECYLKDIIYKLGENIRWKDFLFIEQMKATAFELGRERMCRKQFPCEDGNKVFPFFNRLAWRDFTFMVSHKVFES